MLQNAYLIAKIGTDTAENERKFAKNLQLPYGSTTRPLPGFPSWAAGSTPPARPPRRRTWAKSTYVMVEKLAKLAELAIFHKILQIFGGLVLGCIKHFVTKIC